MNRYLQSILVFDVAFPALLVGVPAAILLWAFLSFQSFVAQRTADFDDYQQRERQVAVLKSQLGRLQPKVPLLKALLSGNDVDARVDHSILAAVEKYSGDEIERSLCDFEAGPSSIGKSFGDGRQVQLKFLSRWEPLNTAALDWETANPNLVLETLSIERVAAGTNTAPVLEAAMSYYIVTEN